MNQAVKDELQYKADSLRRHALRYEDSAKELQEEASKLLCQAKQATIEAAEFDRLIAIYEAAR